MPTPNFVYLEGFIAVEPKRIGDNGPAVFPLSFAERIKNNGNWETKYKLMSIKCWGNARDVAAGLSKGELISIRGRLSIDSFVPKGQEASVDKPIVIAEQIATIPKVEKPEQTEEWKF